MKKNAFLILVALLGGCTTNGGMGSNSLVASQIIGPLIDNQCRSELNKRQEWKLASAVMGNDVKQQWENKICGCVSEEVPSQMSTEEMIQVVNPATRSQVVANVATKTVSACINRILR
ncbi:MAG: hypothetical protein Q4A74_08335 [Cardiobacteriaceae bacterium]|nr:hypothetical protein [Cardiobacteriaceae bacterium]